MQDSEAEQKKAEKKPPEDREDEAPQSSKKPRVVPEAKEAKVAAQKVTPYLWFNVETEEAMAFYTSLFKDSCVHSILRYPSGATEGPMAGMDGRVLNGSFQLAGQAFHGLDGGPYFKFTPAVSFFVNCETEQEVDQLWARLSPEAKVMMELQEYPFSKKFGWLADKYGLSWQMSWAPRKQKITPFLMFVGKNHGKAEEAIKFYTSLFPDSGIVQIERWEGNDSETTGTIKHAIFRLNGTEYACMESKGSHDFNFNEAVSFMINCQDQQELDFFWEKLSAVPDSEQCGWLKDKYGLSWQVVPCLLNDFMLDPSPEKNQRIMKAVLGMKKLDFEPLKRAFEGE